VTAASPPAIAPESTPHQNHLAAITRAHGLALKEPCSARPSSPSPFFRPHLQVDIMAAQISKKRKFVADGVFQAELGEFL
jgi:hypothetical protein